MAMKTIRELQAALPWGAHDYTREFQARTAPQRDAMHAALHITKAAGKLAGALDNWDHTEPDRMDLHEVRNVAAKALADLVICAMRIANTWPGGAIDLQDAIEARLAEKFPARRGREGG